MKLSKKQVKATKWLIERYRSVSVEEIEKVNDVNKLFRVNSSCVLCRATVPKINIIIDVIREKIFKRFGLYSINLWISYHFRIRDCRKCVWRGASENDCTCADPTNEESFKNIYYSTNSEFMAKACKVRAYLLEEQLNK